MRRYNVMLRSGFPLRRMFVAQASATADRSMLGWELATISPQSRADRDEGFTRAARLMTPAGRSEQIIFPIEFKKSDGRHYSAAWEGCPRCATICSTQRSTRGL